MSVYSNRCSRSPEEALQWCVDHLREAAVIVVPLRIGGGTRIKIYEGMAMGKATVSTTIGAEGLDVEHGRDILLEDGPSEFANAIVALLRDDTMRRRYEAAAATTAAKYDWSLISQQFVEELHKTIDEAADRGVPRAHPDSLRRRHVPAE